MKLTDPTVDISLFSLPIGKKDIFCNRKPLVLEIGFGEGEFLINAAQCDASRNYFGLEIKRGRFRKAVRAAEKLSLENLKFLHIEAEIALRQVFRERMFDLVLVNFPDPWPKKRHSKHRMFNREFISCLAKVLTKNGRTVIKTDQLSYIEQIVSEFQRSRLFRPVHPPPGFVEARRGETETKFEKHFRETSQEIFSAVFLNLS
jgi:tRNA (guanine-N7-)-methyltransferase